MSCMTLAFASMVVLGRDTTIPSGVSDENRSNLLVIDQQQLRIDVDVINCRWSARLKGTKVSMNNAYFLPGNDPSGWKVISSINNDDKNDLGDFVTVTLRGKKPGELDFNYQVSVSKSGHDMIISLGRSNNTGHSIDVTDQLFQSCGIIRYPLSRGQDRTAQTCCATHHRPCSCANLCLT